MAGTTRRLYGHAEPIIGVRFSTDGTRALSGDNDGAICLWDLHMGELIRRIEMGSHASAFAFTNDLAYAFWGHSGYNWFAVVDCRSEDWQSAPVFEGHERPVTCLAVPGHARVVVSGSADRSLRVWEVENRKQILRLDGHSTGITCVDITADGRRIV